MLYNRAMCHCIAVTCNSKIIGYYKKTAIMVEQLFLGMWPTTLPSFVTETSIRVVRIPYEEKVILQGKESTYILYLYIWWPRTTLSKLFLAFCVSV